VLKLPGGATSAKYLWTSSHWTLWSCNHSVIRNYIDWGVSLQPAHCVVGVRCVKHRHSLSIVFHLYWEI